MSTFSPIAVVGRACVLPRAMSPVELWERVVSGTDLTSTVPKDRWGIAPADVLCDPENDSTDRIWSDRGGYVSGFDDVFDATGFGLPADEITGLDPVFQWTFHTAREALRDAGYGEHDAARFGAVFGNLSFPSASMAAFAQAVHLADGALPDAHLPDARNRFMSGLPALMLERALDLGVGAMALDAACASSLYAIKLACDRLHDGEADLMLAGAVNCADDLFIHQGFTALNALSPTGQSRPFHPEANGLVPAEGCGFVALRRLDDAVRDGDTIHGIIRGVGLSNDGRGRGMLAPAVDGQVRAMQTAFDVAGITPNDISLLEC
ncbi:MAG: beta-ketoacyl [acyl carrier protein] synthase domain-containing protein, partial [Acidimicrobiales bacterium]